VIPGSNPGDRTIILVQNHKFFMPRHMLLYAREEACSYLKDYLEERLRDGEQLTPDPAIVKPKVAQKLFIRTVNIGDMMRLAIRSAGFLGDRTFYGVILIRS
jgi:hypothetical protein